MKELIQLRQLGCHKISLDITTFPGQVQIQCRQMSKDKTGVYTYTEHSVLDTEDKVFDELLRRVHKFSELFRSE